MNKSVITLAAWCALHRQNGGNWRRRAAAGEFAGAYKSGRIWLVPASSPAPPVRPRGRPPLDK